MRRRAKIATQPEEQVIPTPAPEFSSIPVIPVKPGLGSDL